MSWPKASIESIAAPVKYACVGGPFGSKLTGKDYVSEGIPVIRGANMGERFISNDDFVFVTESKVNKDLSSNLAHPGDVVFTQRGTLGQVSLVPENAKFERYVVSQSQMKLTVDESKADSKYIYYYFSSKETVKKIMNYVSTSGVPHINLTVLRNFEIPLPKLEQQQEIAKTLSTYDDLIENNKRRIELLEESARQLYKEWFVRFRFPGHEHVKIIDGVPEGWSKGCVSDLGEVITGKTPSTKVDENYGGDIPFIKTPDMHGNTVVIQTGQSLTERGANTQPKKLIPANSVMVSCIGTIGVTSINAFPSHTNQQINSVIPKASEYRYFLFFALASLKARMEAMGGGATMANVNKAKFSGLPVLLPNSKLLESFHEVVEPIFSQIHILTIYDKQLSQARDLLLPKLMGGNIAV